MVNNVETCSESIIHDDIVTRVQERMLSPEIFDRSSNFFKVMGNSTRFQILWALDQNELCVCDISCLLQMTTSAVSHQLAVLREAKLVRTRRDGKVIYYSIADDHVHSMLHGCVDHATEETEESQEGED